MRPTISRGAPSASLLRAGWVGDTPPLGRSGHASITPARTGSSRPSLLNFTAVPSSVGVKAKRPSRSFFNPYHTYGGCCRISPASA